jgi:(1->4)-alpha-D-glucan 1-alpha-D-glucosylmutase
VSAPRIPGCSYRVQLNKNFNFRDATALVDYLDALGVTDLYASPVLAARPGSTHGYDVIDHDRLNADLGTESDLDALSTALRARGMGLILDLVPNHMCIASSDNRWWNDVLENGRSSPFSPFFDIDWHPPKPELREKVLLPVLGEQYGRVLENQEITIRYAAGAFVAGYYEARYPIDPRTIAPLLEPMAADLRRNHPDDHPDVLEIDSIVTATKHLPKRWETDSEKVRERQREKEIVKRRLDALVSGSAAVRDALERSLAAINGEKGKPQSFDRLEALLGDQAYRMSFWGVAAEEINYRRFFDINDLAAIRVEEPVVLGAVHEKAFHLLREGKVTGLRIDHVDGLLEPRRYLENLQHEARGAHAVSLLEDGDGPTGARSTYVVVEKILTGDETLPAEWPVHGTTGYEFVNIVNGLFVDPGGARAIERAYERLRDGTGNFDDLVYRAKKLILRTALSSELYVLASRLDRISEQHRWSRDFTASNLHLALGETIACFPVYRSYVQADTLEVSPGDRQHIMRAVRDAKRRNRSTSESVFDFIADVLLLRDPEGLSDIERGERREFVLRLQQLTGPVMAKGLEDTVFYRYFPLASLDEVGGRPTAGGVDLERFHAWNQARVERWPHGLSTTATHDTKRGEDMRARLDVLTEIPREWRQAVRRWQRLNRRLKSRVDDGRVPESNEEYFIYQTLVGVWPMQGPTHEELSDAEREALATRLAAYMTKALREAKQHTSWININGPYERGVDQFLRRLLAPATGGAFLADMRRFLGTVVPAGARNALVQVGLKATLPGVPDLYQGNELWDLSLVDPDNRRPVDFERRRAMLAELEALDEAALPAFIRGALAHLEDGSLKMLVTMRALRHRRRNAAVFTGGGYLPLAAEGERARHVVAFARTAAGTSSITVGGRFFAALGSGAPADDGRVWNETRLPLPPELPADRYRDALSGVGLATSTDADGRRWLRVADVLATLPIAILEPG